AMGGTETNPQEIPSDVEPEYEETAEGSVTPTRSIQKGNPVNPYITKEHPTVQVATDRTVDRPVPTIPLNLQGKNKAPEKPLEIPKSTRIQEPPKSPPAQGGPFNMNPAFKAFKETLNAKEKVYSLFTKAFN